jgi:hypothetical protein
MVSTSGSSGMLSQDRTTSITARGVRGDRLGGCFRGLAFRREEMLNIQSDYHLVDIEISCLHHSSPRSLLNPGMSGGVAPRCTTQMTYFIRKYGSDALSPARLLPKFLVSSFRRFSHGLEYGYQGVPNRAVFLGIREPRLGSDA